MFELLKDLQNVVKEGLYLRAVADRYDGRPELREALIDAVQRTGAGNATVAATANGQATEERELIAA